MNQLSPKSKIRCIFLFTSVWCSRYWLCENIR